jgi:hypothetical protein
LTVYFNEVEHEIHLSHTTLSIIAE